MALRLRRGTNAERLTITPVESELIYTTDTKELWIGDGVTVGGNKIGGLIPQFLSDLNDVDTDSSIQIGQVLKWDGNNWVASNDDNVGVVEDADYRINIVGLNDEIIVDSSTNTVTGTFVGDGSGLTNLPIPQDGSGIVEGSNYRINIIDDGSTVLVDSATGTFTGIFVGDGSGLTDIPQGSIFDLTDVFALTPPEPGDILAFDGSNFVPQQIPPSGIIEGSDYRINIISDDSSIIVDTDANIVNANEVNASNVNATDVNIDNFLFVGNNLSLLRSSIGSTAGTRALHFNNVVLDENNLGLLVLTSAASGSLDSPTIISDNSSIYSIVNQGYDGSEFVTGSGMYFLTDGEVVPNSGIVPQKFALVMNDLAGDLLLSNGIHYRASQQVGIMTNDPQSTLDVNGNTIIRGDATVSGTITASSFNGSLVADDSTTIIDAIDGSITAQSFVQFGSLTTLERDSLSAINGMVIYNTTANKFQGYQNNNWINLDDGTAG